MFAYFSKRVAIRKKVEKEKKASFFMAAEVGPSELLVGVGPLMELFVGIEELGVELGLGSGINIGTISLQRCWSQH